MYVKHKKKGKVMNSEEINSDMELVRKNIIRLRKKANISQRELASRCGMPHSTLATYESKRSKYKPKPSSIFILADSLGCSPKEIDPSITDTMIEERELIELSPNERFLIRQIRKLMPERQMIYLAKYISEVSKELEN